MKKIQQLYITISVLCLLAIVLGSCSAVPKGTLTIAVAESKPGSKKDPYAHSLYAGAKLAADHINELGGVNGLVVKIVPYADNNDPKLAAQNAQTIVESNASAVIGHSSSESSSAAAPIYALADLPVVNASPVSFELISAYPNFFNISYTTEQQSADLANYTVKSLGYLNASVVFSDDDFGHTLTKKFENTFHGLGGKITLHESIPVTNGGVQQKDLDAIVAKLFALDPQANGPGVLFIAANGNDSAELVIALKNRGFGSPIIGADNLSTLSFIQRIQKESGEQARPGYFTDGIISTRALLPDSARGFASQFVRDYQQAYPNFPVSNSAARGYDAALAIFRAVQNSHINNIDGQQSRAAVEHALRDMNDPKTAFYGVTGPLYFGQDRNAVRQVLFSYYQYGNMISAPTQYEPILLTENVQDLKKQLADGLIIPVDGHYVYVTNVIYTGMDMIEVRELDQKASTYTADFYLWFRYKPQPDKPSFQPENIVFTNAESINSKDVVRE